MTPKSLERLSKVHPALAERVKTLASNLLNHNINIEVVQGLRTFEQQNALFAQGRTTPGKRVTNARGGQSNHNYGLAVDVCPFKNGQPDWDDDGAFEIIGSEAKKLDLEWGGDWQRFPDRPHLELGGLTIKECYHLHRQGGLQAVWDRATKLQEAV